jgi:hypothetical protein
MIASGAEPTAGCAAPGRIEPCKPGIGRGLDIGRSEEQIEYNQPRPSDPKEDAVWAKMFRIFRCSAVVVPLFCRCYRPLF